MAVENKRLSFILNMVDKVTEPSRKAAQALQGFSEDVTKAQGKVNKLKGEAGDMEAFQRHQKSVVDTSAKLRAMGVQSDALAAKVHKGNGAYRKSAQELKKAETALEKMRSTTGITTDAIEEQARKVELMQKAHLRTQKSVEGHRAELKSHRAEVKAAETALGKYQGELTRTGDKLTAAGHDVNDLGRAFERNNSRMDKASRELQQHQQQLDKARRKQDELTRSKERHNNIMAASAKYTAGGAGMVAAGGIATAGVVAAANPYRQFDKGMSAVQATGRMTDTDKAELMAKVDALASDSVFDHVQAAGAAGFLAQSGMDKSQIAEALGPVMSLAAATSSDLMQTADIASNILSGFQLDADQMGRVGDVLTMAANSFNVDLGMLGETMKYLAPVASKLGMGMEEATAMAGLLGNVGIQGSQAGNALKSMSGSLAAPNKAKAAILNGLDIKTKDGNGNMLAMPEILKELKAKTAGMGNADMTAMFKTLFGEEFYGPAMEIVSQGGDILDKAIKDMYEAQGAAAEAERIRLDNLDGDVIKFGNQIAAARIKFGAYLDGTFRAVTQWGVKAMESINQWMAKHPALVKAFGIVAMVAGVVTAALGSLGMAAGIALFAFGNLLRIAQVLGPVLALLRTRLFMLGPALMKVVGAMKMMGVAALTNPLAWLAVAAVAAAVVIYKHWDQISAFFSGFWLGVKEGLLPLLDIWDGLVKALGPVGEAISELIGWFGGLLDPVTSTDEELKALGDTGQKFGRLFALAAIGITAVKLALAACTAVQWAFNAAMAANPMVWIVAGIAALIAAGVALYYNWGVVRDYFREIWNSINFSFEGGLAAIKAIIGYSPIGLVMGVYSAIWEYWSSWWDGITERFGGGWEAIKHFMSLSPMEMITGVWGEVTAFFDNMWDRITNRFTEGWKTIVDGAKKVAGFFGMDMGGSPELNETTDKAKDADKAGKEKPGLWERANSWMTSGYGKLDEKPELKEAVNDAPAKGSDGSTAAQPMKQGNQVPAKQQTITHTVTVSPTIHVTAQQGQSTEDIGREVAKQIEEMQRRAEWDNRGRLYD